MANETVLEGTILTDANREIIHRFVAEHCVGSSDSRQMKLHAFVANRLDRISGRVDDFALAAARRGTTAESDSEANSGEEVTFVFISDEIGDLNDAHREWRAEMSLPANAAVDSMLAITIADGQGAAVDGGVFKVAGVALPVAAGKAEIPYGLFLSGIKDARVELTTADGVRIPGTLALF